MEQRKLQPENYADLNTTARLGQIAVFGSTYASSLALAELAQDNDIKEKVYNRSINGLTVYHAKDYIKLCAADLAPQKLFVNIGDEDLKSPAFDNVSFSSAYADLITELEKELPHTKLFLVSVFGEGKKCDDVNLFIENLAKKRGHIYIDISCYTTEKNRNLKVYNAISPFFRLAPMSFADAMQR